MLLRGGEEIDQDQGLGGLRASRPVVRGRGVRPLGLRQGARDLRGQEGMPWGHLRAGRRKVSQ